MKERTQETAIVPTGETTAELIPEPAGLCLMRLEDIIRNRMEYRLQATNYPITTQAQGHVP